MNTTNHKTRALERRLGNRMRSRLPDWAVEPVMFVQGAGPINPAPVLYLEAPEPV